MNLDKRPQRARFAAVCAGLLAGAALLSTSAPLATASGRLLVVAVNPNWVAPNGSVNLTLSYAMEDRSPIGDAEVRVYLRSQTMIELASGRTNANGTLETSFVAPGQEGAYEIEVQANKGGFTDVVTQSLTVSNQPAPRWSDVPVGADLLWAGVAGAVGVVAVVVGVVAWRMAARRDRRDSPKSG